MNPKDWSGHVPDEPREDVTSDFDQQLAATRERLANIQTEMVVNAIALSFEIGRLRGVLEERNRQEAAG